MRDLFLSNPSKPLLAACALMTSALLGNSVARADNCRSWHIEVTAQLSGLVYDEAGNLIYADSTGSGYASHLGAMSIVGFDYFTPPENGIQVVNGHGIFTAADGDQVFVSFDGTAVDLATGTGTGTYVVTGGTGRFENATGSAGLSTSLAGSGFSVTADGTLCF